MSDNRPMIGFRVKVQDHTNRVRQAAEKGAYRSFGHAAASIRKEAIALIVRAPMASLAGMPVHTRRGFAKRAVLYSADKTGAVIGFSAAKIDQAMEVHEYGGVRFGRKYPARPTMDPALRKNLDRFAAEWRDSVT